MRLISTLLLYFGTAGFAVAHSLDSEHNLTDQLLHQVLGNHHFPITILLVVAGLIASSIYYRKASKHNQP